MRYKNLHIFWDRSGSVSLEFALIAFLFVTLTFSVFDLSLALWQWTMAEKATEIGARWATTSDPVASGLETFDCLNANVSAGESCTGTDAATFGTVECYGRSLTCSGGFAFSSSAFESLVARMRDVFPSIAPANVVVSYRDLRLGYAGRGAPVPAITVRLVGMNYSFVVLGSLLGGPLSMPDFRTTLTGEDLKTEGYS